MFAARRPGSNTLNDLLRIAEDQDFSYLEVGATATTLPAGYRHDRWRSDLGPDSDGRFDRASAALRQWAPQRGAGMTIFPDSPVAEHRTFVLVVPLPMVGVAVATARVVYLVDELDRSGFAYGTLPGHPEKGEESFVVIRRDNRVTFEITAFSRPHHALARLGGPITRLVQLRATRRYIAALSYASDPHQSR